MSREALNQVLERWMNDEAFRAQVRQDPKAAIRGAGVELTDEEWAAVKNVDWSLSDEELHARASKIGGHGCFCA